jgi:hypothetical protein
MRLRRFGDRPIDAVRFSRFGHPYVLVPPFARASLGSCVSFALLLCHHGRFGLGQCLAARRRR